jgi:hypothetical protein
MTIQTYSLCGMGIANDTVRQKRSKAIAMRFYWVRRGQFTGPTNMADYFTKHHPPSAHREIRPTYLLSSSCSSDALA